MKPSEKEDSTFSPSMCQNYDWDSNQFVVWLGTFQLETFWKNHSTILGSHHLPSLSPLSYPTVPFTNNSLNLFPCDLWLRLATFTPLNKYKSLFHWIQYFFPLCNLYQAILNNLWTWESQISANLNTRVRFFRSWSGHWRSGKRVGNCVPLWVPKKHEKEKMSRFIQLMLTLQNKW